MATQVPAMQLFLLMVFVSVAVQATSAVWVDVSDGMTQCIKCIRLHPNAGNCYHASWPGTLYDRCSNEGTKRECEDNGDGV